MEELSVETFDKAKQGNAVVDFWAPWCGPCKMQGPIFEEVSKETEGVGFFKVNVDDYGELAQEFGVRGIPTMIFFKDGKVLQSHSGLLDKAALSAKIKQHFG